MFAIIPGTSSASAAFGQFDVGTFNSYLTASTPLSSVATTSPQCIRNCGGGGGDNGLSGGAIAGIVVGSVVGCCIILVLVGLLFCGGRLCGFGPEKKIPADGTAAGKISSPSRRPPSNRCRNAAHRCEE